MAEHIRMCSQGLNKKLKMTIDAQEVAADTVSVCCRKLVDVFAGVCVCQVTCSSSQPQD